MYYHTVTYDPSDELNKWFIGTLHQNNVLYKAVPLQI